VSDAREEILARIRTALRDVPVSEAASDVPVARDYRHTDDRPRPELVELLCERIGDYRADVRRVAPAEVAGAVQDACADMGLSRLAVAPGLPPQWRPAAVELVEDHGLAAAELDEIDGALTGCAGAIAETGTLVLDGQALSGRRLLTLVPDHHICVVSADQVVGQVPEAMAALAPAVAKHGVPVTLVSGPSASSDIELTRVEGVHGPRHLLVLIVEYESDRTTELR
jgi:L-lactate dehydrogenase complex protein LldG